MIYVIHAEGTDRYKIGYAKQPEQRLIQLQVGCPVKLVLVGAISGGKKGDEDRLHDRFWIRRVTGEWFVFSPLEIEGLMTGETPNKRPWNSKGQ